MSEPQLLAVVGALFVILGTLLSWIGVRIFDKVDKIAELVMLANKEFRDRLDTLSAELREKIGELDRRITRIETRCDFEHSGDD